MNQKVMFSSGKTLLSVVLSILLVCFISSCKKGNNDSPCKSTLIGSWDLQKLTYLYDSGIVVYDKQYLDANDIIESYHFYSDSSLDIETNRYGEGLRVYNGGWSTFHDTIDMVIVFSGVVRQKKVTYSIECNILKTKSAYDEPSDLMESEWKSR